MSPAWVTKGIQKMTALLTFVTTELLYQSTENLADKEALVWILRAAAPWRKWNCKEVHYVGSRHAREKDGTMGWHPDIKAAWVAVGDAEFGSASGKDISGQQVLAAFCKGLGVELCDDGRPRISGSVCNLWVTRAADGNLAWLRPRNADIHGSTVAPRTADVMFLEWLERLSLHFSDPKVSCEL